MENKPVKVYFDNDYERSKHLLVMDFEDGSQQIEIGDGCLHASDVYKAVKSWEQTSKK